MSLFDRYTAEGRSCELTAAEIDRSDMTLRLGVSLDFVIPQDELRHTGDLLMKKVPEISRVEFELGYHDIAPRDEEALVRYIPYLISEYDSKSGGLLNSLKAEDISVSEGEISLKVLGNTAADALNDGMADIFSSRILDDLGIDTRVTFIHDREQYDKSLEQAKKKAEEYIPGPVPLSSGRKSVKTAAFDGKHIKGRTVKGEPVPLADIDEESGTVVIRGEVFSVETRNSRNDSRLVLFAVGENTSSMMCKAFMTKEAWEGAASVFEPGISVKVKGTAQWDDYQHAVTVKADDIEIVEKETRRDLSPEKRVELHAHTKMSAMDGLSDPRGLVELAAGWGHKAVAVTDHGVVQAFPDVYKASKEFGIKAIYGMEGYLYEDKDGAVSHRDAETSHIIILAKNSTGLGNLYKLVSLSHLDHFYKKPRLPRSLIRKYREGLILGSACVAGELFRALLSGAGDERLDEIASFYDYLEIQPVANNMFLVRNGTIADEEGLRDLNRKIVETGRRTGRPVAATCDTHYLESGDDVFRKVLQAGQNYDEVDQEGGLYMRTTDEMLEEFSYLGEETAHEVVIGSTCKIASMTEDISPIAPGKYPPRIPDSEKTLRETCEKNAADRYGDPLPGPIRERLDKELDSIIGNGYSVMYILAKLIVDKSLSDGYVVGSRGSVGSSFAATMSGITEVNPLPPHYICPECRHLEWGDGEKYSCGVDMPEKTCPECGAMMEQDGYDIPFETFLGFSGDKEPDIDLNFASEYQHIAHKYVEDLFGTGNIFKAGTISAIGLKTARAFALKYFEKTGRRHTPLDIEWYASRCVGVKRTTGQHPGGIIILPKGHDINEFTPVQRPANDTGSDITTTHFDYHSIDGNLLKLDLLGHDGPTMIRYLSELTGIAADSVPLKDARVDSIFNSTDALDIVMDDYMFTHGTYGIPEFGTGFVRQMLDDIKPRKFADLIQIAGLSHGTDVWLNNAQRFIREGHVTIDDVICTRDDILRYLLRKGLPAEEAFRIMERVRKGKGLSPENEKLMTENGVPPWYVESCRLIKYMFPRAHAVAYVMMSYRIAYFKVYHPQAFYAAYLTTKISDFNWDTISQGIYEVESRIKSISQRSGPEEDDKEKKELVVYEVVYEMLARGLSFAPPSLTDSDAGKFTLAGDKVRVPLCALEGVGGSVGQQIVLQREIRPFDTVEDLQTRAKVNRTGTESLRRHGVLDGLPESDQISFFDPGH